MPEPRNPCPTGQHHQHPRLNCDEYEKWRREMDAAIHGPSPDAEPPTG
jgi:hypothetical protein